MRVELLALGWDVNEYGQPKRSTDSSWKVNRSRASMTKTYDIPGVGLMPAVAYSVVIKNIVADIKRYWLIDERNIKCSVSDDNHLLVTVTL